ncbi:prolyl oligopeptidase family serine peptidase [Micromonospora sp. NPDC023633]|uniref:alpha/beta hydrolase family protein n=1 Tax=Micromonospora sp. NPDC023633 TaxID=3154320 RepID=UPI0033ECEA95
METAAFDYDRDAPLDVERHGQVVTGDLTISELTYDHGAGGRARATLIVPARPSGTGVILAHGGTDDGRHFFVDEATSMAERGMTTLLTAYRLPPHGDQRATADAVRTAVLTQLRGLDLLTAWADRLCYFGHSAGAYLGAILSAVEPRLFALALASYGSGTLQRLAAASLPQNDPAADAYVEFLHRYEPASYVAVPGARRLLFQHGSDDEVVYVSEGLRLFHAAAELKEWREYPCGHDTSTPPQARADRLRLFAATPQ